MRISLSNSFAELEECRREAHVQEMRKLAVENERLKQKYATLLVENENKSTLVR